MKYVALLTFFSFFSHADIISDEDKAQYPISNEVVKYLKQSEINKLNERINIDALVGDYKLDSSKSESCPNKIKIKKSKSTLIVSGESQLHSLHPNAEFDTLLEKASAFALFANIDEGAKESEDQFVWGLMKRKTIVWTTNDSLNSVKKQTELYNNSSQMTKVEKVSLVLTDKGLEISKVLENGAGPVSKFKCKYKSISKE